MATLLDYDLAVRRGGNKYRLIARSYVALMDQGRARNCTQAYAAFRDEHEGWTFAALHDAYDRVLPAQYRTKTGNAGRGRKAKQANGMTEAQQAKFDRFCKAPARLEKQFLKTADHFKGCIDFYGHTDELQASVDMYQSAANYMANLIGDTQDLAMLWSLGMRTSGDLETHVERWMRAKRR